MDVTNPPSLTTTPAVLNEESFQTWRPSDDGRRDKSHRGKRALLIAITYSTSASVPERLKLPRSHKDILALRNKLIERNYHPEDVVVLSDDPTRSAEMQRPTKANLMKALRLFIEPGASHVFAYSGYSGQWPEPIRLPTPTSPTRPASSLATGDELEEDGLQEFILPCDDTETPPGQHEAPPEPFRHQVIISDVVLRACLLPRLVGDTTLVAIFDSYSSQNMLNLAHGRCNRVSGAKARFRRIGRTALFEPLNWLTEQLIIFPPSFRKKLHIKALTCTGLCVRQRARPGEENHVLCISAAGDSRGGEFTNRQYTSLIKCVIDCINEHPRHGPTLKYVMRRAKEEADKAVDDLREELRKAIDVSEDPVEGEERVMMEAPRWQPQLSSSRPVDMGTRLVL